LAEVVGSRLLVLKPDGATCASGALPFSKAVSRPGVKVPRWRSAAFVGYWKVRDF